MSLYVALLTLLFIVMSNFSSVVILSVLCNGFNFINIKTWKTKNVTIAVYYIQMLL